MPRPRSRAARRRPIIRLIFCLPSLLVITRFLWPLGLTPWIKWPVAALMLIVSQYHALSRWSSGSMFSPEFPRPIVVFFNWGLSAVILLAFMQLALDLTTLPIAFFAGGIAVPDGVRAGMAAIAGIVAAYGVQQAVRVPPLKDVEIVIRDLPPQFDGYRLLQLTDLHLSRLFPARWARAVVQRANALGVDAILITGDLIDGSIASRAADIEPLRDLRAPDGVYVIPGNHEYFFSYDAWMQHFAAMGMRVLDNRHVVLNRGDDRMIVAGVTDLSAAGHGLPASSLGTALQGAPPDVTVVLMAHQPSGARQAAAQGVKLQLSGHTHGGMVVGLDRLVAGGNEGFVSGAYAVDGMTLYVNNGTGLWPGFAFRLGRPSELTRLTLRAAG